VTPGAGSSFSRASLPSDQALPIQQATLARTLPTDYRFSTGAVVGFAIPPHNLGRTESVPLAVFFDTRGAGCGHYEGMKRFLTLARGGLAETSDHHLLERFLADRDGEAFAELVRRYTPVVWGACRRALAATVDAEDAFQATFLVLVRRADRLTSHPALGPWLYRVALMTARNLNRSNRRRAVVGGTLRHDIPEPASVERIDARLDLDDALLELPERDRAAVVLCHLQGLSRREAATRLGCPEGTLSAVLAAALRKLRVKLGGRDPAAVLALCGTALVPAGLAAATKRSATIYATSTLSAAGVSPTVAGLTNGVLQMFLMKKLVTAAVMVGLVVVGGVLAAGLGGRTDMAARAADPPPTSRATGPNDQNDPTKRLEVRLADLQKQKEELDRAVAAVAAEKAALERAKAEKAAVAALGSDLAVVFTVVKGKPTYTVREVIGGKVGEMNCSDLEMLATYLTRIFNDPKGPRTLRLEADEHFSDERVRPVCAACAAAGYTRAVFIGPPVPRTDRLIYRTPLVTEIKARDVVYKVVTLGEEYQKTEIEFRKFAPPEPVKKP